MNAYLRGITGQDFTAKDFRTWSGTVLAACALRAMEAGGGGGQRRANRNIVRAMESVAERLGNTPAICRKCYVHPGVLEAYLDGSLPRSRAAARSRNGLPAEEAMVLGLLAARTKGGSAR